ncbi:MAG: 6-phosphogluconolactonase [Acidimicrobiales bacterium]
MLRTEFVDANRWASRGADVIATAVTNAIVARGRCVLALSGSATPQPVFAELARRQFPWNKIIIIQIDERLAPLGSPERNLTAQQQAFSDNRLRWLPLPVDAADETGVVPAAALTQYESELAELLAGNPIDVAQLGLGLDGHTASLVPGDPLVEQSGGLVGQSIAYNGARRLTLTRSDQCKSTSHMARHRRSQASMVERLVAGDVTIPAGRISQERAIVVADDAARLASSNFPSVSAGYPRQSQADGVRRGVGRERLAVPPGPTRLQRHACELGHEIEFDGQT